MERGCQAPPPRAQFRPLLLVSPFCPGPAADLRGQGQWVVGSAGSPGHMAQLQAHRPQTPMPTSFLAWGSPTGELGAKAHVGCGARRPGTRGCCVWPGQRPDGPGTRGCSGWPGCCCPLPAGRRIPCGQGLPYLTPQPPSLAQERFSHKLPSSAAGPLPPLNPSPQPDPVPHFPIFRGHLLPWPCRPKSSDSSHHTAAKAVSEDTFPTGQHSTGAELFWGGRDEGPDAKPGWWTEASTHGGRQHQHGNLHSWPSSQVQPTRCWRGAPSLLWGLHPSRVSTLLP